MRKIISSIDIDGDSVRLVVGEYFDNRLHILSASKIECKGMERSRVIDEEMTIDAVKRAVKDCSDTLGINIQKCILGLSMQNARLAKSSAAIKVKDVNYKITGEDVNEVMNKSADGKVPADYVLVSVVPVEFTIDGDEVVSMPVGRISENLGLKSVVISLSKKYVSTMLDIMNKAGLKVVDVVPNALGDYYAFKDVDTNDNAGAVINLGYDCTTVSIFNKGIISNINTFPLGVKNVVNDISYINHIDDGESSAIYKDIVLASPRFASPNEYRIILDVDGREIKLNQYDMSEIAESRIIEILNLAKKQINILTKKKISYIIVTGSLIELRDFNLVLEKVYGKSAQIGAMNLLGARDNSLSSVVGNIKYFEEKLSLRDKSFSVFSTQELERMNNREINSNNNSLLGRVFGYFFDN